MPFVNSTLANDQNYAVSGMNDNGLKRSIFIAGKANIPNRHMLILPSASTEVSDAELAELQKNHVFNLHVKNGYITVEHKKASAEKVASNMNKSDKSKPKTAEELEVEGKQTPKK